MTIFISEIIKSGTVCNLSLGATIDEVISLLGTHDDRSKLKKKVEILRYEDFQIILKENVVVQMIVQLQGLSAVYLD